MLILRCGERFALRQRPKKGLLAGHVGRRGWKAFGSRTLWSNQLEKQGAQVLSIRPLAPSRHIFTHVEWHMQGWAVELETPLADYIWADSQTMGEQYALPSAFKGYFGELGIGK